ncbi:MAG: HIRAN domain-containing protein [Oscillospiraceae bacterium]|nr:HIRAN domain-containing protein [Oscillospiraceae bacterium]
MYERSRNLLDCHIAGFAYYDGLDVIDHLQPGTAVSLTCDPENPYDPEAVAISFGNTKLGYIPRAKNSIVSSLLYFGYSPILDAKICSRNLDERPEHQFRIVIKFKDNRT